MADILETPENAAVQPPSDPAAATPGIAGQPGPSGAPVNPSPTPGTAGPVASMVKKAVAYGKKNWWLILLPLPVIVIVVAFKHRKK
jgi:hypothetical protein